MLSGKDYYWQAVYLNNNDRGRKICNTLPVSVGHSPNIAVTLPEEMVITVLKFLVARLTGTPCRLSPGRRKPALLCWPKAHYRREASLLQLSALPVSAAFMSVPNILGKTQGCPGLDLQERQKALWEQTWLRELFAYTLLCYTTYVSNNQQH